FQAEDGIRDYKVTGVQTCALPISAPAVHWFLFGPALAHDEVLLRAWDVASGRGLGPQRRSFVVRRRDVLGPDGRPAPTPQPWSRSEERRVGKEGRAGWGRGDEQER